MMLGREGYAGTHCLYFTLLAKQWKEKHGECLIQYGVDEWTMRKLLEPFLNAQINQQSSSQEQLPTTVAPNASTNSRWQKEAPIWTCIPIENVIVPMLHILLGLGNDVIDNFWSEWFDEQVEQLTPEEIESRHMVLLAEISVEESEAKFKRHDDEKKELIKMRIEINKTLKEKGLDQMTKQHLNDQKQELLSNIETLQNAQEIANK